MLKSRLFVVRAAALVAILIGGQAHADPTYVEKKFCFSGVSDGIGWEWKLVDNDTIQMGTIPNGTVPNGLVNSDSGFAAAWSQSINGQQPPVARYNAFREQVGTTDRLVIRNLADLSFTMYVRTPPATEWTLIQLDVATAFNPFVAEGLGPIPTLTEWGLIILGILLTVGVAWTYIRRRRVLVTA